LTRSVSRAGQVGCSSWLSNTTSGRRLRLHTDGPMAQGATQNRDISAEAMERAPPRSLPSPNAYTPQTKAIAAPRSVITRTKRRGTKGWRASFIGHRLRFIEASDRAQQDGALCSHRDQLLGPEPFGELVDLALRAGHGERDLGGQQVRVLDELALEL
jgi:hypothetical protein